MQSRQHATELLKVATIGAWAVKENIVENGYRSRFAAFWQSNVTRMRP
jgi:hypothetical protein